jgi:superfamily II DNA or RNA helicase
MACRCGKTLVAYGVAPEYLWPPAKPAAKPAADPADRPAKPPRVLILVPGLSLLRQTVQKLALYGACAAADCSLLLVGSDARPIEVPGGAAPSMTTDPAVIAAAFATPGPLFVISTYQSSELLPDVFDLTIFDEAHRVCGAAGLRPFTQVLLGHSRGDRLYMTATPRYDAPVSMKDRELFGGVAYRYHMRDGIDAGYVNDFGLELLGAPAPEAVAAQAESAGVFGAIGAAFGWALRGAEPPPYTALTALAAQVLEAASDPGTAKLLVFCRSIRHAAELQQEVEALAVYWRATRGGKGGAPLPEFTTLAAHSRMPGAEVARALGRFAAPGERAILFNCRLFQEGVEIPALNGVFFAAPRHSPRDIIQSLCRALNALPGKPLSKIYVPLTYDPGLDPADPANLERFASIVPFMDALMAEDPLLYEHLLDPAGTPYPLRWVESRAAAAGRVKLARYDPDRLLAAARLRVRGGGRAGGERLLRAARIPWRIGFAELERIVRECGRYVKTTDKFVYGAGAGAAEVNFHGFFVFCREAYKKWQAGEVQPLEPHQINDLRSLPEWETRGLGGPYPWAECLGVLEAWLRDHGGVPPMLEINTGGYVGLDASPFERLSGALTCINQGDGKDRKGSARPGSGFTIDAAKQRDLDELCARWGLRWRKERGPPPPGAPPGAVGPLICDEKGRYTGAPSFIQEAHARFKEEWKTKGESSEYISTYFKDFPIKHRRQERLDVLESKRAPPRWRKKTKRGTPASVQPSASGAAPAASAAGAASSSNRSGFFGRLFGRGVKK